MRQDEIKRFNDKGIFLGDSYSSPNIGIPGGILSQISTEYIESIFAKRSAVEVAGSQKKVINWYDEEYLNPNIEPTGQTTPYGDFSQAKTAGINLNFDKYGHYRFSTGVTIGNLEELQLAEAKVNAYERQFGAALTSLEIERNRAGFYGFIDNTANKFLTYGILNNPFMPSWETAPKAFTAMTYDEVTQFFATAIAKLTKQTGGNIDGNSKIRVALASDKNAYLDGVTSTYGVSVKANLKTNYPNLEFVGAPELNGAYNNLDCIYFIGESMAGGVAETMFLGYSEIARSENMVIETKFRKTEISSGTVGLVLNKPLFVLRYAGI